MARKASSKPDSGSPDTASIGIEADFRWDGICRVTPKPARFDSAGLSSEDAPKILSEARENNARLACGQQFVDCSKSL